MGRLDPSDLVEDERPSGMRSSGRAAASSCPRIHVHGAGSDLMALEQSIDLALARTIGAGGFPQVAIEAALVGSSRMPLTRLREDDASRPAAAAPHAARDATTSARSATRRRGSRRDATDVVFLGTGGSSLGGQTLAQLTRLRRAGRRALRREPARALPRQSRPVTFDARAAAPAARLDALRGDLEIGRHRRDPDADDRRALGARQGRPARARRRAHPRPLRAAQERRGRNALRDLLEPEGVRVPRPSYRASAGAIPCSPMSACCRPPCSASNRGDPRRAPPTPMTRSAPARPAEESRRRSAPRSRSPPRSRARASPSLMAYADRLERFTRWWVQLWAESLGKDGKGSQPVAAIGPVDQHSQLQLYLAGPNDKLFTDHHRRQSRARAGDRRRSWPSAPASRASPASASATSSPRRAAPRPTRSPGTAARPGASMSSASTSARSASSSCTSCWRRSLPATRSASIRSTSRRWRRARSSPSNISPKAGDDSAPRRTGARDARLGMTVRRLDPILVDRIAAGEVVERPAAAVKELVENAIDAGAAQRSRSRSRRGGRRLIRVVDDGGGMAPEDLDLAVERHATSKLPDGDLFAIATLGFRGEALPSIGAVARLSIATRTPRRGDRLGHRRRGRREGPGAAGRGGARHPHRGHRPLRRDAGAPEIPEERPRRGAGRRRDACAASPSRIRRSASRWKASI